MMESAHVSDCSGILFGFGGVFLASKIKKI